MLLLIDNYDSFTYNLFQYLSELGEDVEVVRNDKATVQELDDMGPERLVVSPGPSHPRNAGISIDAIQHFAGKVPVSGRLSRPPSHRRGVRRRSRSCRRVETRQNLNDRARWDRGVFKDLPNPFEAVRYHSLAVQPDAVPPGFEISARSAESGIIMGMRHPEMPIEGVQFHPESILTRPGKDLLRNFLEMGVRTI